MTISLSMITNKADNCIKVLDKYEQYFDELVITVADKDKKQFNKIQSTVLSKKLKLSYFKWNDNFAEAREYNRSQITTDFALWIDDDDEISDPELIKGVVSMMSEQALDMVQLKYEYARNEQNESVADHWRERFWRVDHDVKWVGAVHETLITPNAHVVKLDNLKIIHHKSPNDNLKALERNKKILEADYEKNKDPRTAHYLALTYMGEQDYPKAIKFFLDHIQASGWPEESYRSWCKIAESEYMLGNYRQAISATDGAVNLLPEYPDAYYIKAMTYSEMQEFGKCVEWVKVALSKPEPETLSIVDPTLYKYRGLFMAALAYLQLGKVKEAYGLYTEVMKRAPNYPIADGLKDIFEEAYYDQEAIDRVRWLLHYVKDTGGKPVKLFESLTPRLLADPRLNAERVKFFPKKKWPKNSIAYFCGQAAESWGPDTLDKGMGGSEEAVVNLSRELVKLGHEVTVFNDREEEYTDPVIGDDGKFNFGNVEYQPWTLLNPYDDFDIFIAWRAPENANGVKARKIFCDLHDVVEPQRVYACAKNIDKYFVKSKYHRDLYPELPDDKFVIIGNGINKEHFNA